MLNMTEAAQRLGMSVSGLRKLVDRTRHQASGPRIRFHQPSRRDAIRFEPTWLEKYIADHSHDPDTAVQQTATRSRRPAERATRQTVKYGFDPALLA